MDQKLIDEVILQLGYSEDDIDPTSVEHDDLMATINDINRHGMEGGFSGFTYYTDTRAFFERNRALILESLNAEIYNGIGYSNAIEFVAAFKCAADFSADEIGIALYGPVNEAHDLLANCLSWYAAEEAASWILVMMEEAA